MSKPIGEELKEWCKRWATTDHQGKQRLAVESGISYETARHWYSDSPEEYKFKLGDSIVLGTTPVEKYPNTPTLLKLTEPMTTIAVLGDLHMPYQDNDTVKVVNDFLVEQQPNIIVYNGDISDFYQVSEFAKDPSRLGQLQDDLDAVYALLAYHHSMIPKAKKIFIEGTHENRWVKYLQQKAPAVANLDNVTIPALYRLDDLGIEFVPFERGLLINDIFMILHGDIVLQHSSFTAKKQYETHGGNGMCNHTHRGGSYYKKNSFGTWGWWENFCLCRLDPDWTLNPDWGQGFSLVHFDNKKRFWVEQIPIIHHKFIYGGKVYS